MFDMSDVEPRESPAGLAMLEVGFIADVSSCQVEPSNINVKTAFVTPPVTRSPILSDDLEGGSQCYNIRCALRP